MAKVNRRLVGLLVVLIINVFGISISPADAFLPRIIRGRPTGGFLGAPGPSYDEDGNLKVLAPPGDEWFEQKLDHFDGSNTATWKQRFFRNKSFYKSGGPLFVQIGGEGRASPEWLVKGAWVDYAEKYGAYCALLEHRFYGDSHPTKDMGVDNLRFLSSEQALADLANFITWLRGQIGQPKAKVIVFGGSYPGSLAAWFRLKYPHIAHGAVASSAPLLAKVNFFEYQEVVDASLKTHSDSCNQAITEATAKVKAALDTYDGRQELKKMFQLCDTIDPNVPKDQMNLFSILAGNFDGIVQYNKDNRKFEGAVGTNITIDTVCEIMEDSSKGSAYQRYAMVNSLMLKTYDQKCVDFKYDKMIDDLRLTDWNSSAAEGGRQWTYQTCSEFAFYQSSDSKKQPFGQDFPIEFWLEQCADIFGSKFTPVQIADAVARSNQDYGALSIQVTRVLFPNGSIDPWHALGVTEDLSLEAKAVFINGTAHCANMYPASPTDLPGLTAARVIIQSEIGKWLSQ